VERGKAPGAAEGATRRVVEGTSNERMSIAEALRVPGRRRMGGLVAALLFEALVVLVLLVLGGPRVVPMSGGGALKTFDVSVPSPEPEKEEQSRPKPAETARQPVTAAPVPTPPVPTPAPPIAAPAVKLPSPVLALPPDQMAAADLRNLPSAPPAPRAVSGPPAPRGEADTPLVDGSGPNGERLYAASWYREPYDSELRGYLSTADPGWALIACKTVPDFKVDDCVGIDEWPKGSRMLRAVLAAAWQFKVRPPRVGGRLQVGEWVRIRIDYSLKGRG